MNNNHSPHTNDIIKEIATQDPLDDRAFKILLSDDEIFTALATSIRGSRLDEDSIIDINGEMVFTVKGRVIRLDTLRATSMEYINIEGQIDPALFPYKRHLYYSAVIYAMSLQKSESFHDLKPVTSIVVYKKKPGTNLMETAHMYGNLIKTDSDKNQLTLIAINTEKWRDAPTEELRGYLATLHHGIMHEENRSNFTGVDFENPIFDHFQKAARRACAQTKYQEYLERGEVSVATKFISFISDEDRMAAKAEGREEGINTALEIIKLLKEGVPKTEIAKKFRVAPATLDELSIAL